LSYGADMHKRSHTIAAVGSTSGELLGERTVGVGVRGFGALLVWARGLGGERVWALEDCRHVSGSFERFLIARGERVVRLALGVWPARVRAEVLDLGHGAILVIAFLGPLLAHLILTGQRPQLATVARAGAAWKSPAEGGALLAVSL
jgi:hypothetical protein